MNNILNAPEKPILMNTAMVRATLADIKTQTRRIVKHQQYITGAPRSFKAYEVEDDLFGFSNDDHDWVCLFGQPGHRLYVRETFAPTRGSGGHEYPDEWCYFEWDKELCGPIKEGAQDLHLFYRADGEDNLPAEFSMPGGSEIRWTPSIHMPRWASRIDLEIISVRIERLQDISEEDCQAEGVDPDPVKFGDCCYTDAFIRLWDSIEGAGAWALNPYLWVIEFKRIQP